MARPRRACKPSQLAREAAETAAAEQLQEAACPPAAAPAPCAPPAAAKRLRRTASADLGAAPELMAGIELLLAAAELEEGAGGRPKRCRLANALSV